MPRTSSCSRAACSATAPAPSPPTVPESHPLVCALRLWYVRESVYLWCAGEQSHRITQSEGGEQGDPLMPALFSVATGSSGPLSKRLHTGMMFISISLPHPTGLHCSTSPSRSPPGSPGHTRHADQLAALLVLRSATSAVCTAVTLAINHDGIRCRSR